MTTLPHPFDRDEVMAYLDGELSPADAARVAAHLRECRHCTSLFEDMQQVSRQMQAWEVEEPAAHAGAGALEGGAARPDGHRRRWIEWALPWRWMVGMPAAAVGGAALCLQLVEPVPPSASFEAPPAIIQGQQGLRVRPELDRLTREPYWRRGWKEIIGADPQTPSLVSDHSKLFRTIRLTLSTSRFDEAAARVSALMPRSGTQRSPMPQDRVSRRTLHASTSVPHGMVATLLGNLKALGTPKEEHQEHVDASIDYAALVLDLATAQDTKRRLLTTRDDRAHSRADLDQLAARIERVRRLIGRIEAEKQEFDERSARVSVQLEIIEE